MSYLLDSGKKLTIGIFVASKSPVIIITASEEEFQCWLSKLQAACNTGAQVSKDATESVVSTMVRKFASNIML